MSNVCLFSNLILTIFIVFSFGAAKASDYRELKESLESKYGIGIKFDKIKPPTDKNGKPESYKFKLIPNNERLVTLQGLKKDLEKYPWEIIRHNVNKIYLVKKIQRGTRSSGPVAMVVGKTSAIYLTNTEFLPNYGGLTLNFHHEISSLLWYFYEGFPEEEWRSLNPKGFHYENEGRDLKVHNKIKKYKTRHEKQLKGFFWFYSLTSIENDLNTIFEVMMGFDQKSLDHLSRKYPLIQAKLKLMEKFYNKVKADAKAQRCQFDSHLCNGSTWLGKY